MIYFNKVDDNNFEILDGQQRITSIGRFITGKFDIMIDGNHFSFGSLPMEKQNIILNYKLLVYECEGSESDIKEWFKTINIAGIPLNDQELLNAVYSGPFVTLAKAEFSNSQDKARIAKWSAYISGTVNRQDFLERALEWVSTSQKMTTSKYMSDHRDDDNIAELKTYFNTVIDWVSSIFANVEKEMKGLKWGELYERFHNENYNINHINERLQELYKDYTVKNKKGIFEYLLGKEKDTKLLEIRIFDDGTKRTVYDIQTDEAKEKGISNCPTCATGHEAVIKKIWKIEEMDADHVTAWSNGGSTQIENCQMLCKTHNRAKGNK